MLIPRPGLTAMPLAAAAANVRREGDASAALAPTLLPPLPPPRQATAPVTAAERGEATGPRTS